MIYESSREYGTMVITLLFDGDPPSKEEIDNYTRENYGETGEAFITPPSRYYGMDNPGVIIVIPEVSKETQNFNSKVS
jgi:hypothetical protein